MKHIVIYWDGAGSHTHRYDREDQARALCTILENRKKAGRVKRYFYSKEEK